MESRDSVAPSPKRTGVDNRLKTTDWVIAISGGASALAAILSACAAIYAAGQLNGTSRQTDAAINRMADLAKATQDQARSLRGEFAEMRGQTVELVRQAGAAERAASSSQQMDRSYLLTERGSLTMEKMGARFTNGPEGARLILSYTIRNVGRTPAILDAVPIGVSIGGGPPAPIRKYPDPGAKLINFIGADRTVSYKDIGAKDPIADAGSVPGLIAGVFDAYIEGRINYRDTFGRAHESGFCFRVQSDRGVLTATPYPLAVYWYYT